VSFVVIGFAGFYPETLQATPNSRPCSGSAPVTRKYMSKGSTTSN